MIWKGKILYSFSGDHVLNYDSEKLRSTDKMLFQNQGKLLFNGRQNTSPLIGIIIIQGYFNYSVDM